jgi:cytochrome P450
VGLRQVVAVADPELIQQILRNRPKLYRRLSTIEPVTKELGVNGVFSAEGEDWKRQRRVIAHALDASHLRPFFPTLVKVTERLRNRRNISRAERYTVILLCRPCHKQIHAVFTESELAREYASTEALAAHPKIARFVEWIARQPPRADISVRRKRA